MGMGLYELLLFGGMLLLLVYFNWMIKSFSLLLKQSMIGVILFSMGFFIVATFTSFIFRRLTRLFS